jgi:hypothetical protein
MKVLLILLTLSLLSVVGLAFFFFTQRPDDANYFSGYLQMSESDRALARDALAVIRAAPGMERAQLEAHYQNAEMRKRYAGNNTSESTQQLIVESLQTANALNNEKFVENQAAQERFKMRIGEYRDFEGDLATERSNLRAERESFERQRAAWEKLRSDTALNQLVLDIDKTERKYDQVASRFRLLPLEHQAYVQGAVTKGAARDALFTALAPEQQQALTSYLTTISDKSKKVLAASAYDSLTDEQKSQFAKFMAAMEKAGTSGDAVANSVK